MPVTVGVLALQGGVIEHLALLRRAASQIDISKKGGDGKDTIWDFIEVRTKEQLALCDALIIPGGESTTMAIVSARLGLLDPLRQFVKVDRKPVWGTCAGLVMLAEEASATKLGGQELIGGLNVKVSRNHYGTQIQSFVSNLDLTFLGPKDSVSEPAAPFRGVFIRAPVVEKILSDPADAGEKGAQVEVLGVLKKKSVKGDNKEFPEAAREPGDIVAVRQQHVFGTSFHPELTDDARIHVWWLKQVLEMVGTDKA